MKTHAEFLNELKSYLKECKDRKIDEYDNFAMGMVTKAKHILRKIEQFESEPKEKAKMKILSMKILSIIIITIWGICCGILFKPALLAVGISMVGSFVISGIAVIIANQHIE